MPRFPCVFVCGYLSTQFDARVQQSTQYLLVYAGLMLLVTIFMWIRGVSVTFFS